MDEPNIYAAPTTDVNLDTEPNQGLTSIHHELKSQGTWRLFFLSVITLGIYLAHYIRRQTNILNKNLSHGEQISGGFITTILVMSYITAILVIPYSLLEEGHIIERVSDLSDKIFNICLLVWAFKARNRMNTILQVKAGSPHWFHGLWTFLFQGLYFNYKVNKLKENA